MSIYCSVEKIGIDTAEREKRFGLLAWPAPLTRLSLWAKKRPGSGREAGRAHVEGVLQGRRDELPLGKGVDIGPALEFRDFYARK